MRTSNSPPDARHTEAACATMRRATRLVMLTGTPSLNRPFDLFRQVPSPLCQDRAWPTGACMLIGGILLHADLPEVSMQPFS